MRIADVRCVLVTAPYGLPGEVERELYMPSGLRSAAFVVVSSDTGATGVGEAYAGVYAPEPVRAIVEQVAREVIGREVARVKDTLEVLRVATGYWGRMGLTRGVIGAIECGLLDLLGKEQGVPVCQLLGGPVHERLPVYASGGLAADPGSVSAEIERVIEDGYGAYKARVHRMDLDEIAERIDLCHRAAADRLRLAVEASQGLELSPWPLETALEVAHRLAPYDPLWLEEPLGATDLAGYARLRELSPVPIAGGETITSLFEAHVYLEAGAFDVLQPDAVVVDGPSAFVAISDAAAARGVDVAAHAWSSGVGVMANVHAGFASRACRFLELPNVVNQLRDDVIAQPLAPQGGMISAPTGPGLGVDLPDDIEDRYPYRPGSHYRVAAGISI